MKTRRTIVAALGVGVMLLASTTFGTAASGRPTYLTFSGSVALPGITLRAGTYTFEQLGSSADLVRVSSRDGTWVYLTAFTTPVNRPEGLRADVPVLLGEAPAHMPQPIKAWFPEHSRVGHEFVY